MMRYDLITGIGGALLVVIFIFLFGSNTPQYFHAPSAAESSRLGPVETAGTIATPNASPAATTTAQAPRASVPAAPTKPTATTPPKTTSTAPAPPVATTQASAQAPPTTTETAAPQAPTVPPELALALPALRSALVNIICISKDPAVRSISGSGVIIDSRGVILTVAHVAQFFLLNDYPTKGSVECVVRAGSPAVSSYVAEPIYISEPWLRANPTTFTSASATGTGENDFALLAITGAAGGASLPSSFPYVSLSNSDPSVDDQAVIGSYGAEFASSAEIRSSLYPTLVFGAVQALYTFNTDTIDVISLGGTAASQEGSSGGAAVNASGNIIGLITTSTTNGNFSTRDLHAITPRHIRASFLADTGTSLDSFLKGNIGTLLSDFDGNKAALAHILIKATQ